MIEKLLKSTVIVNINQATNAVKKKYSYYRKTKFKLQDIVGNATFDKFDTILINENFSLIEVFTI